MHKKIAKTKLPGLFLIYLGVYNQTSQLLEIFIKTLKITGEIVFNLMWKRGNQMLWMIKNIKMENPSFQI